MFTDPCSLDTHVMALFAESFQSAVLTTRTFKFTTTVSLFIVFTEYCSFDPHVMAFSAIIGIVTSVDAVDFSIYPFFFRGIFISAASVRHVVKLCYLRGGGCVVLK